MRRGKQPPALYPPRRKSLEALAREAGEAADIALGSAQIAKRAADSMPKPDRRLDPNFQRFSGQEQSFLARISPGRNRCPSCARSTSASLRSTPARRA